MIAWRNSDWTIDMWNVGRRRQWLCRVSDGMRYVAIVGALRICQTDGARAGWLWTEPEPAVIIITNLPTKRMRYEKSVNEIVVPNNFF